MGRGLWTRDRLRRRRGVLGGVVAGPPEAVAFTDALAATVFVLPSAPRTVTARAVDANGVVVTGEAIEVVSSNPGVVTVDTSMDLASGVCTATVTRVASGDATLTARLVSDPLLASDARPVRARSMARFIVAGNSRADEALTAYQTYTMGYNWVSILRNYFDGDARLDIVSMAHAGEDYANVRTRLGTTEFTDHLQADCLHFLVLEEVVNYVNHAATPTIAGCIAEIEATFTAADTAASGAGFALHGKTHVPAYPSNFAAAYADIALGVNAWLHSGAGRALLVDLHTTTGTASGTSAATDAELGWPAAGGDGGIASTELSYDGCHLTPNGNVVHATYDLPMVERLTGITFPRTTSVTLSAQDAGIALSLGRAQRFTATAANGGGTLTGRRPSMGLTAATRYAIGEWMPRWQPGTTAALLAWLDYTGSEHAFPNDMAVLTAAAGTATLRLRDIGYTRDVSITVTADALPSSETPVPLEFQWLWLENGSAWTAIDAAFQTHDASYLTVAGGLTTEMRDVRGSTVGARPLVVPGGASAPSRTANGRTVFTSGTALQSDADDDAFGAAAGVSHVWYFGRRDTEASIAAPRPVLSVRRADGTHALGLDTGIATFRLTTTDPTNGTLLTNTAASRNAGGSGTGTTVHRDPAKLYAIPDPYLTPDGGGQVAGTAGAGLNPASDQSARLRLETAGELDWLVGFRDTVPSFRVERVLYFMSDLARNGRPTT